MRTLLSRPTGDVLVILFAATICLTVLIAGTSLVVVRLAQPDRDLTASIGALSDVVNTMLGLTAGFVAGRTEVTREKMQTNAEKDNE
jgi:hypothetical protein